MNQGLSEFTPISSRGRELVELAAQAGATTADHLKRTDQHGIETLAKAGVQPVLLPASVYTLGSYGFAPARAMIEAGLGLVLATDFNPGSSPTPSMPFVLSLASTHMRMTPAEGITAATINAAYSLGRGNQIGSLEPGKQADFVIHDCTDYREIAYFTGVEPAFQTYLRGRLVYSRKVGITETRARARLAPGSHLPEQPLRNRCRHDGGRSGLQLTASPPPQGIFARRAASPTVRSCPAW